jgi:hypothetical protein
LEVARKKIGKIEKTADACKRSDFDNMHEQQAMTVGKEKD